MNTNHHDKKIVYEGISSYTVEKDDEDVGEKSCASCKHFFHNQFPTQFPCSDCRRLSRWVSHIEVVEFTLPPKCDDPLISTQNPELRCKDDLALLHPKDFGGKHLPDSGDRREFSTGSVRDVREGKGRYDLLSPLALKAYAKRMEDGMSKYGERNWEKGQPVMSYLDSAMRHLWNFIEDRMKGRVPEEDHLGASMWNVASCIHTIEMIRRGSLPKELDDTPKPTFTEEDK